MATTKNQIIFSILNDLRGGEQSNNEAISESQLSWEIDNVRAKLIRNDLNKRRSINPDIVQTLCIPLIQDDKTACCDITNCTILRSILQLPECIELERKNLLISVGPINLTLPRFSLLPYHRAIHYNPNKFSKAICGCFLHNKYLYIITPNLKYDLLEICTAEVILERPEEAQAYICRRVSCYTEDSPYPISAVMLEDLRSIILQKRINPPLSDGTNNSTHDLKSNVTK